jgi:hypothetical protein
VALDGFSGERGSRLTQLSSPNDHLPILYHLKREFMIDAEQYFNAILSGAKESKIMSRIIADRNIEIRYPKAYPAPLNFESIV